jgi:hypothetical protein
MRKLLFAFFSESSVEKTASCFWTTTGGQKISATHVSRDMSLSDFQKPVTDDYGRVISEEPTPLPSDLVFVGGVWADSVELDYDHMDPNLSWSKPDAPR